MLGDNGKRFNYNTRRRIKETKRSKINTLIDNRKKKVLINDISIKTYETQLNEYSKKTVSSDTFNKYLELKFKLKKMIREEKTYNKYLQKQNWFSYINNCRHEDNLLNELKKLMVTMQL